MRFWASASLASMAIFCSASAAEAPPQPRTRSHRSNELTLAGLRPGRDTTAKAIRLYGKPDSLSPDHQSLNWAFEADAAFYLNLEVDKANVLQLVRVSRGPGPSGVNLPKHGAFFLRAWQSGRGLAAGALASRVVELYGEPDSRSPSTKDGQQLELLYYAFDWAGADVPQVMEVLCTVAKGGKPGRVVEITLAAPSL